MVDDINKLRPELLQKSPAELRRQRDEIDMALAEIERQAEIKAKAALADEANNHIDAVVAGVKFLHDNGLLPEKVAAAFQRSDGMFTPATALRNVTAEQLVGGRAKTTRRKAGEPRKRRRRNKATGELE